MFKTKKNLLPFLWWLQRIMFFWVKSKSVPSKLVKHIGLDMKKPVCYILKTKSLTDLFIIDYHCKKEGLPRPIFKLSQLKETNYGSHTFISKPGFIQQHLDKQKEKNLIPLFEMCDKEQTDIQIVPVSIFWGRNPGRTETSLFKLLFFDARNGGLIQRFFTFIAHGRNVYCHFGKSINTKPMLSEFKQEAVGQASKKMHRVLSLHFMQQRTATLGPNIYIRSRAIKSLLRSKAVNDAISKEAERKKISIHKAQHYAYKYFNEIAADLSYPILRLMEIIVSWVCKRIYTKINIYNTDHLHDIADKHGIVYLPCHRSHMDYLLLNTSLMRSGLTPPHTAAGVNLNFWPIGSLFRRGGAFFIRRTFAGNRLYKAVFKEYINFLLTEGYSLGFYIEGGRSRTGRLLKPKTGMLSMILDNYQKNSEKKIMLVPVYIGYDKMLEGVSYLKELSGKNKKKESMGQILGARKHLSKSSGHAYINFGKAIDLHDEIENYQKKYNLDFDNDGLPAEFTNKIADKAMARINKASVLSPVSLFSLALVSTPNKALNESDLISLTEKWSTLLKICPYDVDMILPENSLKEQLLYSETIAPFSRFKHPGGDVIHINEKDSALLTYYRNNAQHLFAVPSLIAAFFEHKLSMKRTELVSGCNYLYRFIKKEYFIHWSIKEFDQVCNSYIDAMIEIGFLTFDSHTEEILRPEFLKVEYSYLKILGEVIGHTIKRYALFAGLLFRYHNKAKITLAEFKKECELLSQRLCILSGIKDPEFFDKTLFMGFVDLLKEYGYISINAQDISIDASLKELAEKSMELLSVDVKQSILRSTDLTET